ncbi:MAG: energy-coupling factor ABC transporter permease, partial [Deltaproteobacteria bacterium]|nr:energy-coupling factor ABC transporter permease [Deltaproteobacteria bacterium]
ISALILAANLPVMIIEGIITAFCVAFIKKVNPVMLPGYTQQMSGFQGPRVPGAKEND